MLRLLGLLALVCATWSFAGCGSASSIDTGIPENVGPNPKMLDPGGEVTTPTKASPGRPAMR